MSESTPPHRVADQAAGENICTAVVFEYSQTGQLTESVDALVAPLITSGWRVRRIAVEPVRPFPFPWPVPRFFGVFPACVDEDATVDLATPVSELHSKPGELVILAYQVWYLAPSLPIRTLLNRHRDIFAEREVLTLVVCRDKWYSAAVEVHRRLTEMGARIAGAVAAIDTRAHALTLVSTLRWLLFGKRDGSWFGRAGVGPEELSRLAELGERIAEQKSADEIAAVLRDNDSAPVMPVLAAADLMAGKMFRRWGGGIRRASLIGAPARVAMLMAFVIWLGIAIIAGLPVLALARLIGGERFDRAVRARVAVALGQTSVIGART
ncbi:hypothetical protein ACL02S_18420 [Nocardia sp. 004]|uniref:hypothetical protein n=1 Tax=Nocardia sp. 004 TaxID=3385978 RepID=UPI0039A1821C